ncbi:MAG: phenylacetate--CoA ligase family protein [[Clostridium] leptum]
MGRLPVLRVIDPHTGKNVPDGESGELVVTTLRKQGAPLIRYRTHDLTRLLKGDCPCGRSYPRIDTLIGRTDDMIKVKGVNIFPGQIDGTKGSWRRPAANTKS